MRQLIRVTELLGCRTGLFLLVASTACAPTMPRSPKPYAMQVNTSVELRFPASDGVPPEPPVFIDGSWLTDGGAVVPLTASVFSSFPATARARRKHPVRIVPRQTLGLPDGDAPVTLFNGYELEIVLDTKPSLLSQYAYQLAHELCHVLIVSPAIDDLAAWTQHLQMPNRWVNEMLCELASFQVLPQLARSWADEPPYPKASVYAPSFRTYIDRERADAEQLPGDRTFAAWLVQHADYLRHQAVDRPKNAAIATQLLPLFEARPSLWTCVTYLHAGANEAPPEQLSSLIRRWRTRAPQSCRADIEAFASVLGVSLE